MHGPSRPVSNYFEYESVQAIMSHAGGGAVAPTHSPPQQAPPPPQTQQPASLHKTRGAPATSSYSSNHSATRANPLPVNFNSYNNNNNYGSGNNNNINSFDPRMHHSNSSYPTNISGDNSSGAAYYHHNNNSNNNTSQHNSSSGSSHQQHNSLPRRTTANLHQHFTDNLPLVTGRQQNQQIYHSGSSKHSKNFQQPPLHVPIPVYHSKSKLIALD